MTEGAGLRRARIARWTLAVSPLLILATAVVYKVRDPRAYRLALRDARSVEDMQVILFTAAAVLALGAAVSLRRAASRHALPWLVLSLGLGFVALEELSWGHRVLGYELPDALRGLNTQGEMTLHNVRGVQDKVKWLLWLTCLYASFGRLMVPSRLRQSHGDVLDLYLPKWPEPAWFLPGVALYAIFLFQPSIVRLNMWSLYVANDQTRRFLMFKDQEVVELLIAGGFFLFTARVWWTWRRPDQSR